MPPEVQTFFDEISIGTVVVWGIGLTVVGGLLRKLWPLLKKLSDFLDDVAGEPARPGVPARPGLMERVQSIEHELFPNSGKSLRDQTNRMEEKLDRDHDRIGKLKDELAAHLSKCAHRCGQETKETS